MNDMKWAEILCGVYDYAKLDEAVYQVNLFGIRDVEELKSGGCIIKQIVEFSGIQQGYVSKINKGMKLSRYMVF